MRRFFPRPNTRLSKQRRHQDGRKGIFTAETLEPRQLLDGSAIISEIMYHAASHDPLDDWLELYNQGNEPVNLQGYSFDQGIQFAFSDTDELTLAPGEYLVVAASLDNFNAAYPGVTNVVGGWAGSLSNSGESVAVVDTEGNRVDRVSYADSGDFSQRRLVENYSDVTDIVNACRGASTFYGWVWEAPHDGEGSSLELINNSTSNNSGQNWTASTIVGGTPGAANSVASANIAPTISDIRHAPAIPTDHDAVSISATIADDGDDVQMVTLYYRESTLAPGEFLAVAMLDDGEDTDRFANDGIYTGVIPPHADDAVVEFYLETSDATNNTRTKPAPSDDLGGQDANLLYQVDNTRHPDNIPLYRTVMTVPERELFQMFDHRCSDALRNVTIIADIGGEVDIRYNGGIRYRGSDSRSSTPPNIRLKLPSDTPLHGLTDMNINGQAPEDLVASTALWALAGEHSQDAWPVRLWENNNDLGSGRYFAQLEPINSEWAEKHFPNDSNGNGYKGRRANEGPPGGFGSTLEYYGEETTPYISYLKQTNESEADWSDVIELTRALQAPLDLAEVERVMNVDQWLRSMAITQLTGDNEYGLLTGDANGDDWAMYRGVEDPRFIYLPYDHDTMFEQLNRDIFGALNVPAIQRLFSVPGIIQRYYAQFLDLMDNVFTEDVVRSHLTQVFGDVEPETTVDRAVNYLRNRSNNIRARIPTALTVSSGLEVVNGLARTTTISSGQLSGTAHAVRTSEVLVNGQPTSWNERNAAWNIDGVDLSPGINRVLVQAFDASGAEFERTFIDIWRDTGRTTDVGGMVSADTSWTAAQSPYFVTSDLTVEAGSTLTIEPGTTVFFSDDVQMTILGRLLAVGTEENLIRFTREPSTTEWSGLQFRDTAENNMIHYAVLEWGITTSGMIGLENSRLEVESSVFDNTDRRRIRTIDSSLTVRNSTFESIFEPGEAPTSDNQSEHVWGRGILDGGEFILDGNTFGHITGHNDSVDYDAPTAGTMPHILNNYFVGGGDDALDLTGNVHIEGNVFRNYIKDQFNTDPGQSNTISSSGGTFYVFRNVFENVQHASLIKEDAFMHFQHNTVINSSFDALYFDLPGQTSGPGRGADVDGSIFWNVAHAVGLDYAPTDGFTLDYSLVPADEIAAGIGNVAGDPVMDLDTANTKTSDFRLGAGSTAAGAGYHGADLGAGIQGAVVTGEPNAMTRDTSATLLVGGATITHYRYRVNGGAFSEELPVETPIELIGLADGTYTVEVVGRDLLGNVQDEADAFASRSWTVDSTISRLVINEVLASNNGGFNHQDTFPDVIELFNDSELQLDLSGMMLTDDLNTAEVDRFVIPAGTTIGGGEYLLLFAETPDETDGIHTGFRISGEGEGVYLFASAATGGELVDSIEFGPQITDLSIGRGNHDQWTLTQPTLGGPNIEIKLGDPATLRINEWMAHSDVIFRDDYIELYNPNPSPVALGGLFLTDNATSVPHQHEIAPLTFIDGNGLQLFLAGGSPQDGPNHLNFAMSSQSEVLGIFDADFNRIDWVRYVPQFVDISAGLTPNGGRVISKFILPNPNIDNPTSDVANRVTASAITDDWRYLDDGSDQGTAWIHPDFDDTAWPEGPGLLFVEGEPLPAPKSTPLNIGHTTYYFRRKFDMPTDPSEVEFVDLRTVVDDGVIVYVNGAEVLRLGMPNGDVNFDTLANRTINEAAFESSIISADAFLPGENTIAVEVHQTSLNSSDIVFGLDVVLQQRSEDTISNEQLLSEQLRITEIMYNPIGGTDFEYIEVANVGDVPINLNGVRVSQGIEFTFGSVDLDPGGYGVIVNDTSSFQSRYGNAVPILGEYGGSLSNGGERIRLQLPTPYENNILDFSYDDEWYSVTDGGGFSLVVFDPLGRRSDWDRREGWRPSNFINGSPGTQENTLEGDIIVFNEILANTQGAAGDQIELLNTTPGQLNLAGWYLSDDPEMLTKYQIPNDTMIDPGGVIAFSQADDFGGEFSLADHGGSVFLSSPDATESLAGILVQTDYGAVDVENSIGRYVNSDGAAHFVEQAGNTLGGPNNGPRVGPVVINEINYRPLDGKAEFIELLNTSTETVDLFHPSDPGQTWELQGDVSYTLPEGLQLESGQYLVIAGSDPATFRAENNVPAGVMVLGPYVGELADADGRVRLVRPGHPSVDPPPIILVEEVQYDDAAPWAELPATVNVALNRLDSQSYGNESTNWGLSVVDGTPGQLNVGVDTTPPSPPTDLSAQVIAGPEIEVTWTASIENETSIDSYTIFRDGIPIGTSTSTSFVDTDVLPPVGFSYVVSATNTQDLTSSVSDPATIQVMSASVISRIENQVTVRFTDPITPESAEDSTNYTIDNGIEILDAAVSTDGTTVVLNTTPLLPDFGYTISINNIDSPTAQFPPGFTTMFQFLQGVPGFSIRGIHTSSIPDLSTAIMTTELPIGSPIIDREAVGTYASVNFLDDDGHIEDGIFAASALFPGDTTGDNDNFVIHAQGILTIPAGQGGRWSFGTNVAVPNGEIVQRPIVPFGAVWSFLDDGSDQGTAWREPDFDDSSWASGPGQLGYGDGDEATQVSFGPDSNNKFATTYFRHEFQVHDVDSIFRVPAALIRDDGAAVYLNGVEVYRNNLAGDARFNDFANNTTGTEDTPREFEIVSSLLVEGRNVLAVEVHQADGDSSDLSMDLNVVGDYLNSDLNEDGFLFRIDGDDVLVGDSPNNSADRFGSVDLPEGIHEIEFIFFDTTGAAEVELFAAPGEFTQLDQTDTWRLVGDVSNGGLSVTTEPLPPVEIEWSRNSLPGSMVFEYSSSPALGGSESGVTYEAELTAGQVISATAMPDTAALLSLSIVGPSGLGANSDATTAGSRIGIGEFVAPSDGTYRIHVVSDVPANANVFMLLNSLLESEALGGEANDSTASAQDLTGSLFAVGGIDRYAVTGITDGARSEFTETGTLFAGNVLTFEFTNVPSGAPAQLTFQAAGDLDGSSEFVTVDIEGQLQVVLFEQTSDLTATIDLSAQQMATLAADGILHVAVTPSDSVDDFGDSRLTVSFEVASEFGDFYAWPLVEGQHVTAVLRARGPGDVNLAMVSPDGTTLAVSQQQYNGAIITEFVVPETGTYFLQANGDAETPYELLPVLESTFDIGGNDTPSDAQNVSFYGSVIGHVSDGQIPGDVGDDEQVPTSLPVFIDDGDGFSWDIGFEGAIGDGTNDAYDGGLRHTDFFGTGNGLIENDGREVVIGPIASFTNPAIEVTRKIYVAEDAGFARFLEIVTNTSTSATDYSTVITSNFGSDGNTQIEGTSNGDNFFDADDNWLVTSDGGNFDPPLAHVIAGDGAVVRPSTASLFGDNTSYQYDLTLGAGETQIIMHFAAQHGNVADALTKAEVLVGLGLGAIDGMSTAELAQVVNFATTDAVDYYAVSVSAGDMLAITTSTPATGFVSPSNTLDPAIDLIGPDGTIVATDDNGAGDGRNAMIEFTADMAGDYVIRTTSVSGSGEYTLNVTGYTTQEPTLEVVNVVPMDGAALPFLPTLIRVDFSSPVNVTTVTADDVRINGEPAAGIEIVDGDTINFQLDPQSVPADNAFSFELLPGSVSSNAGGLNDGFSSTFTIDVIAPRLVSTLWNGMPFPEDGTLAPRQYSLTFEFSEPLRDEFLDVFDLYIFERNTFDTTYPLGIFYDATTNTFEAFFDVIDEGQYSLILNSADEAFEDFVGNDLDGEAIGGATDGTVTGDGVPGGVYGLDFTVDNGPMTLDRIFRDLLPLGSLASTFERTETYAFPFDADSYSVYLQEGELLDIHVDNSDVALAALEVLSDADVVLQNTSAVEPGDDLNVQFWAPANGRYRIVVRDAAGAAIEDPFSIRIVRNSLLDVTDGYVTDALAGPRLDTEFDRLAVVGSFIPGSPDTIVWGVQPASGDIVLMEPTSGAIAGQFAAPGMLAPEHTNIGLAIAEEGNTLLYVNADADPTTLYRLDPMTGAVKTTESIPGDSYVGLGFESGDLLLATDMELRRQRGYDGLIDNGLTSLVPSGPVAADDGGRVFALFDDGLIREIDPNRPDGIAENSPTITPPADDIEGLAFDGTMLHISTASGELYSMRPDDGVLLSVTSVSGGAFYGLAVYTKPATIFSSSEVEPNNTFQEAQPIDGLFNLDQNSNIGDSSGTDTSESIPHASIDGTGDGTFDLYQFTVETANAVAFFDLDFTSDFYDGYLRLYDSSGNEIGSDDDSNTSEGADGSTNGLDSFLETTIVTPGTYYIEVGSCCVSPVFAGESYQLQVSVTGHAVPVLDTEQVIRPESNWKYLDDGSDQGVAWRQTNFNDAAWSEGVGQFGYGEGDENTVVSFGDDENNKHITTYFRREFEIRDRNTLPTAVLGVLRDDGAVVYLNGIAIHRSNLDPNPAFDEVATASTTGADEDMYFESQVPVGLFREGTNVIAVEVHQRTADSGDLSFDLWMTTQREAATESFPVLPDIDTYVLDLPEDGPRNIDVMLASSIDPGSIQLALLDADRNVVASGTTDVEGSGIAAENIGQGIYRYTVPSGGRYYARVASGEIGNYSLAITDGALQETESASLAEPLVRSLDGYNAAVGYISPPVAEQSADDPAGDSPAHDISRISGEIQGDNLVLEMDFYSDVSNESDLIIAFSLDLDQDEATGAPSLQSQLLPSQPGGPLGVERLVLVNLVDPDSSGVYSTSFDLLSLVPSELTADGIRVTVPLTTLGDDGHINFGGIAGRSGAEFAGDGAPDQEFLTVSDTHMAGEPDVDQFTITMAAGQEVRFYTRTPGDIPDNLNANTLDPSIEILDADGNTVGSDSDSADGHNAELSFTATTSGVYTVQLNAEAGSGTYVLGAERITVPASASVEGRHIVYNNSAFDGNDPSFNAQDDDAVALDKFPLLPGETATFANYTSYSRGINGLAVDIARLAGTPTLDDFTFLVGNSDDISEFTPAPAPTEIIIRSGAGENGSDRVMLRWEDNAIEKQWLMVTMDATAATGLAAPDVFYFGNAIGDSGDSTDNARVNATDEIGARNNQHSFIDPASVDDVYDFNRDQRVNATDEIIARNNGTSFVDELRLIQAGPAATQLPGVLGDFNSDRAVTISDVDTLANAIANADQRAVFDLNEDTLIDTADLAFWLVDIYGTRPGDANLDGSVDAIDFQIWSSNIFSFNQRYSTGDFNADGRTDVLDFSIWNENRFTTHDAEAANVRLPRAPLSATPGVYVFGQRQQDTIARRATDVNRLDHVWALSRSGESHEPLPTAWHALGIWQPRQPDRKTPASTPDRDVPNRDDIFRGLDWL